MSECADIAFGISIHPPREGWDALARLGYSDEQIIFQSTHPVRGGTFYPFAHVVSLAISIHPPREGWDFEL